MRKSIAQQLGFTLMEVAGVALISGTLTALGMPLIKHYAQDQNASGLQEKFASALESARANAVASGQTVSACASADGKSCDRNGEWAKGWLVFMDNGQLDQAEAIAPEDLLSGYRDAASDLQISVFDEDLEKVSLIQFNAQGFSMARSRIGATVCASGSDEISDALVVDRSGRIRSTANLFDQAFGQAFVAKLTEKSTGAQCQGV